MSCSNGCALVRRVRCHGPIALLALLILAALPCSVSAGFFVSWDGDVFAGTLFGGNSNVLNAGSLNQTSYSNSVAISSGGSGWSATADVTGTATLGHLTGTAHGYADNNGALAYGEGTLQTGWYDIFTIPLTAKTEADGYVHLPWSLSLADTISLNATLGVDPAKGSDNSYAQAGLTGYSGGINFIEDTLTDSIPYPLGQHTISGVFLMSPGTIFSLSGGMTLFAEAYAGGAYSGGVAGTVDTTVAANHSADFHLDADPVTGASYTTDSGQNYFSPQVSAVPEPASLTLAGIGIGLAAAYRWRRRRQR